VIGFLLLLLAMAVVLSRRSDGGEALSFRRRNRDGGFLLLIVLLLFLVVLGGQLGSRQAFRALDASRTRGRERSESLRAEARDWSIRCAAMEAELDSLRTGWEWAVESREIVFVQGRVVVGGEGTTLAGATIHVSRHDPTKHVRERPIALDLSSGPDGSFRFEAPRPGEHGLLRLEIRADGFEPARVWIGPDDLDRPLTVTIHRQPS